MHKNLSYAAPCEAIKPQSPRLMQLQSKINAHPQQTAKIIEEFWHAAAQQGTPWIEQLDDKTSRVIFLWRGAQQNVRLIGGPSNDHEWLTRIPKTDIWFKEAIVSNQFIGSYSFAVDLPNVEGYLSHYCPHLDSSLKESRAQRRTVLQVQKLDPYNPHRYLPLNDTSGLRNENYATLKDAPKFINPQDYADTPDPEVKTYTLDSKGLKNQRSIQIYQSKSKNSQQDYITAIFFDGKQYADLLQVPKALDILVEQGKLPPIQAVFVSAPNDAERPKELTPNPEFKALDILVEQGKLPPIQAVFVSAPNDAERPKELTPNPEFKAFFGQELLPWIDQHLPNKRNKKKTVLLGSSLGGLSSAYLALQYPKEISHAVPLSGSFWWQADQVDKPNGMSKIIRSQKTSPEQHWFISANSYESSRNNNDLSILETAPIVAADLKAQGHDVTYKSYAGGHSYAVWQVALQDALRHFFAD
ncbi:alpha/beta hydrolase-fold protein [Acinetobacter pragensis]|uniref:Enterochelin esterase N-terminal domain-containing protein n=1 Tax=Acinetobacter pragensis TaxID=1806892 RepID=A0A151Y4F8_9GAMM|nr:alpha/beta hydrolase-fold protein [Acinetobacter pragensis]KYQ72908.1 hypothetical protein AZH43_08120 [Acinetobacter pragensis]